MVIATFDKGNISIYMRCTTGGTSGTGAVYFLLKFIFCIFCRDKDICCISMWECNMLWLFRQGYECRWWFTDYNWSICTKICTKKCGKFFGLSFSTCFLCFNVLVRITSLIVPHDRLCIHVQDLMYLHQDPILDLAIVIIMLLLLSLPQIRTSPVEQR